MRKFIGGEIAPTGVNGEVAWLGTKHDDKGVLYMWTDNYGWNKLPWGLKEELGTFDQLSAQWEAFRTAIASSPPRRRCRTRGEFDREESQLKASRDPVDRITDETLTKPLFKLSGAEWGMIRRALQGDRSEEFTLRIEQLHRRRRSIVDPMDAQNQR